MHLPLRRLATLYTHSGACAVHVGIVQAADKGVTRAASGNGANGPTGQIGAGCARKRCSN